MSERARHRLLAQDGFGLIEVLVTAVLVVVLATGVLAGLDAASHASGRTKARDTASALAQADQERMRTMSLDQLSNLDVTATQPSCDEDGDGCVDYRVRSQAYWVSDKSGTQTCSGTSTQVSYLKLLSTVTWPDLGGRRPVVIESVLAPPATTMAGNQGSLAVRLVRADGTTPLPGITVSLSGPRSFSAVTNEDGCVLWGYLPAGPGYTVSFGQAGYVDVNGVQDVGVIVGVTAQSVKPLTMLYDRSASADISFTSQLGATTYADQVAEVATLGQNQMSPFQRPFPAPGGAPTTTISAGSLFPFRSGSPGGPYRVFAGSCNPQDPAQQAPDAQPSTYLPDLAPGGSATVSVPLPSIDTRVRVNGRDPVPTDQVKLRFGPRSVGCANPDWTDVPLLPAITSGPEVGRPQLPTSSGPAVGFPYGTYKMCVQATIAGELRRRTFDVALNTAAGVKVPASGTPGVVDLTAGNSEPRSCDEPAP